MRTYWSKSTNSSRSFSWTGLAPWKFAPARPRTLVLPTLELRHCAPSHSFTHPFATNSVLGPIHRQPASLLSLSHAQHPAGPERLPARVIVCPQPPTPVKDAPRERKHRRRRAQPCAGTQPSFRQPFLESTRDIFRFQGPNPACGSGTIFKTFLSTHPGREGTGCTRALLGSAWGARAPGRGASAQGCKRLHHADNIGRLHHTETAGRQAAVATAAEKCIRVG